MELTFQLIELCQRIGDAHSEMVLSLAIDETEKPPVDQKMPVLWEVLRRAGRKRRLRSWAEYWIGEQGAVWSGTDYSERAEIVSSLSRLARDEGWADLAAAAQERLRHRLFGYSSHKEYALQEPLDWVEELFRGEPSAWLEEGLQLLEICQECSEQGGDNRLRSAIEKEIAAAAFRCGPEGAWDFFNRIDPEVDRYWLATVRTTLIAASNSIIAEGTVYEHTDLLALWSCAVGLTRWFDKRQVQTITELRDSILNAVSSEDREEVEDRLRGLTPGEYLREEYDKDRQGSGSSDDDWTSVSDDEVTGAVSELVRSVRQGHEPSLMEIGHLAIRVASENPTNRTELMSALFALVDVNRRYVSSWDHWGKSHPLRELVSAIREDEVWELVRAAVRTAGDEYWARSVPRNIHLVCLYRAMSEGIACLERGTARVFAMHRLWAGLPEHQTGDEEEHSIGTEVGTWPDFVVLVLRCLLSSDSAETVSAALRGLLTLVDVAPGTLATLFDGGRGEQLSRVLLGLEVWASRHPGEAAPILDALWNRKETLDLADRIQLWVCMLTRAQVDREVDVSGTFMPRSADEAKPNTASSILTRPRKLLEIDPEVQGCIRLSNTYSAARCWIDRLGEMTGRNTENLEAAMVERLDERSGELNRDDEEERKRFAVENGDMIITRGVDSLLSSALEHELREPGWSDADAGDIAMAVTHGDDPWILRRSPQPSPSCVDWPPREEVEDWLESRVDKRNVC